MKILIVDDHPVSRKVVRRELENGGYEICEATDGPQCLQTLLSDSEIDLITLDVNMPKMSGYEVCSQLRSWETSGNLHPRGSDLPVIFVTADDTLEGRLEGFEAGATEFVVKGFRKGELLNVVNRILKPAKRMKGVSVLVADDSESVRRVLRSYLGEYGVTVIETTNGREALEVLKRSEFKIDLLITDLDMPIMDGLELCRSTRRDLGLIELPILAISGSFERGTAFDLYKAGATDYLTKPLVKEELFARLNVFLEVILLNKQLRAQVEELDELNKLKDEFLTVCSHDLKSPLTSILGVSDLLASDPSLLAPQKNMVGIIRKSGTFLLEMINDLLDISLIQLENHSLNLIPVHLRNLLEDCVSRACQIAKNKEIQLQMLYCDEDHLLLADPVALVRIFNNLLSNSVKFTPSRGSILVIAKTEAQRVRIEIVDTGVGISEDELAKLFGNYGKQRSKLGTAGEPGTGLGLSIVKGLVEQQQGEINIASTLGKGTCVTLIFPLTTASAIQNEG